MKRDETYDVKYIPNNYDVGVNLIGFNFKIRFLAEGVVLGAILFVCAFFAMGNIENIEFGTKIGTSIAGALIGLIVGIRGINDEPITEFIGHYINFNARKRTAFYNPHIKNEKPYIQQTQENKNAAREKMVALYNNYKNRIEKSNQTKTVAYQNSNQYDPNAMYFEDDIGTIEKPFEYMTKKERKAFLKQQKKKGEGK